MHERHKRIVAANPDLFKGKTVLDLASHNGRWTYAALIAGATYVLGIKGRQELVDRGLPEFAEFPAERYKFICGDVYDQEALARSVGHDRFDTVLCLGLFYHIADHYRLIRQMRGFNPSAMIFDSPFVKLDQPMIRFNQEDSGDPSNAMPEHEDVTAAMRGVASIGFMRQAAKISGYTQSIVPWRMIDTDHADCVKDYLDPSRDSQRMTIVWKARPDKPVW